MVNGRFESLVSNISTVDLNSLARNTQDNNAMLCDVTSSIICQLTNVQLDVSELHLVPHEELDNYKSSRRSQRNVKSESRFVTDYVKRYDICSSVDSRGDVEIFALPNVFIVPILYDLSGVPVGDDHIKCNHWCMVMYHRLSNSWYLFDSLKEFSTDSIRVLAIDNTSLRSRLQLVIHLISSIVSKCNESLLTIAPENALVSLIRCYKQKDEWMCGYYTFDNVNKMIVNYRMYSDEERPVMISTIINSLYDTQDYVHIVEQSRISITENITNLIHLINKNGRNS